MKARIKSNGKIVEVISRFMPRKRNAASRDWVCNLSDGTCINENQLEYIEESIDGLDEAAEEYEKTHTYQRYDGGGLTPEYDATLAESFIAGAKWQEKRNLRFVKQVLSGDFTVFEAGRKYEREQMMEEAVECETVCVKDRLFAVLPVKEFQWTVGDKVRIIIVKEDKK